MHKAFQVHMLNDQGKARATGLADAFERLLSEVERLVGPESHLNGRERALVTTHLELASFYAKKAMAVLPDNHT